MYNIIMNIIEVWRKENKLYESSNYDNIYDNVLLNTGSRIKGQWENSLAIINNDKIIRTSNKGVKQIDDCINKHLEVPKLNKN